MNTRIFQKIAVVILTVSVLFAACTPSGGQEKVVELNPLYTGTWHLVAYGNDDGSSIVTPGLRTFINFQEDGNISGNAGCNNFFGTFTATEDGSFSVGEPLGATLMFCEQFMDEESAFLGALQSAEGFDFNDLEQLVIRFSESENGYDFMLLVNQTEVPLVGTGWVLDSLVSPDGEIAIPPTSAPLLNFSEDGSLSGSGGCNRIMSGFTTEGNTISISEVASSMMYCDGLMELEGRFNESLEQVSKFEVNGDRLVLSDEANNHVLTFTAAEFLLTETQWQLQSINGQGIEESLVVTLTLSPDANNREGIVFGSTGCNRFSGTFMMDGDRLNIDVLAVTAIFCDVGMETEANFLASLQDTLAYQIEYNRLTLYNDNFSLLFIGEHPTLSGLWRVKTLGDGQNPVEMTFDQIILAEIVIEEGANTSMISGTTPCFDYSARYFVDREFITIRELERDALNQCPAGSELDTQYFDALQKAHTYEFHRGNVSLRDVDGNQVMELTQQ